MASALHAVIGAVVLRLLTEGLGLLALLIPLLRWIITLVAGGVFLGIFLPKDGAAYEVGLQLLRNQSDTLTAVIPLGWVLREWHVYPETTSALNASSGRLGLFLLGLLPAVLLFRLAVIRQYSNRFKRNSLALVGDQIGEAAAEVATQPLTPAIPAEFAGSGTLRSRVEDLVTQEASRWSENTARPPLLPSGSSLLDRWLLRLATPGQRSLWALVRPRAEAFRVSYLLIVLVLAVGALLLGVFRPWIEHWMRFLMGVPVFGLMSGFALLVLFSLLETGRDGLLFAMPTLCLALVLVEGLIRLDDRRWLESASRR